MIYIESSWQNRLTTWSLNLICDFETSRIVLFRPLVLVHFERDDLMTVLSGLKYVVIDSGVNWTLLHLTYAHVTCNYPKEISIQTSGVSRKHVFNVCTLPAQSKKLLIAIKPWPSSKRPSLIFTNDFKSLTTSKKHYSCISLISESRSWITEFTQHECLRCRVIYLKHFLEG